MRKSITGVLAIAGVAAAGMLTATSASADLVTRCSGTAGDVTVPGDLVVPAGQTCDLTGTTVDGDVRVRAGADLIGEDVTVTGDIVGAADAYLDLVGSEVAGAVTLNGAYGAVLEESTVSDRVLSRAGEEEIASFVYTLDSALGANLVARSGEVYVENSSIAGTVNSQGTLYTDIFGTFIDGRLVLRDSAEGAILCGVTVQGTSRLAENAGPVQIGSDGPIADCDLGASYWGDTLRIDTNTAGVVVDDSIVNGDLRLQDNEPVAVLGDNVRVRGEVIGDHDSPAELSVQAFSEQASGADHAESIQDRIAERSAAAQEQAAAAGSAGLD
ncbi:hypothetical protein [Ruania albidiflava]|uniref:hypothetical protein n=1 Tax=Ruania albidiflava TaxID=366586 RepID=UPI0003B4FAF6|nr:hypothetical protein [Ruania albidiflava]